MTPVRRDRRKRILAALADRPADARALTIRLGMTGTRDNIRKIRKDLTVMLAEGRVTRWAGPQGLYVWGPADG